jgi:hypothetical protein
MAGPAVTAPMAAGGVVPVAESHAMAARHARSLAQRRALPPLALPAAPPLPLLLRLASRRFRGPRWAKPGDLAWVARERQRPAPDGAVGALRGRVRALRPAAGDRR